MRELPAARAAAAALVALPAALALYLAFTGGGYFAGSTGVATVIVWAAAGLRMVVAPAPLAGLSRAVAVAGAALALLVAWTLVSTAWSDSPARALIEFDRALLYLGLLVLFGSIPRTPGNLAWALRALFAALLAVGAFALLSRVLPELVPIGDNIHSERLSYPLTYWNGLGLLLGLGLVFGVHLASSEREPAALRVLGAASTPLFATGLYFTLSRGAIAVTAVAVVAYLVLARPRGAIAGLAAVLPACAVALVAAYDADLLVSENPTRAAAVAQGEDAALVIGLSMLAAAVIRWAGLMLDRRLERIVVSPRTRRSAAIGAAATGVVAIAAAWLAFGLGGYVDRQYDRFVSGASVSQGDDGRSRLTNPGNNGRLDHWNVALDAFEAEPLLGTGAGTYGITWARERPYVLKVEDAHSLYVEMLSELGLPGLALTLVAVLMVLFGFARGLAGPDRHASAALLAAGGAWAIHAGIDWDWELAAVTAWFFALGGMALAAPAGAARASAGPGNTVRVAAALGCLALAVTPALMAVSQARLNDAVEAFNRDDCESAIDHALGSLEAIPSRPQPFEVLGYCDARLGLDELAIGAMQSGIDRDPENWELHYGLALVRASAGLDPRPAAREALRLNPRGDLPRDAVERFSAGGPPEWKRRARGARLPIR